MTALSWIVRVRPALRPTPIDAFEVRSRGKLSEADVDRAMREIRLALLEADVNFKVVKSFGELKERCLGEGVLDSLDPASRS